MRLHSFNFFYNCNQQALVLQNIWAPGYMVCICVCVWLYLYNQYEDKTNTSKRNELRAAGQKLPDDFYLRAHLVS